MSKLQPVRGTRDLFGADARAHLEVVSRFRSVNDRFGFQPIDTPVFEFTPLFARSLGNTSDVVSKEMYSFDDRNGESLTLRPEFTAGIARAYISNGLQQFAPLKLAAYGPMFRYERPQKGRYRQFYQIDAEIIGAAEPAADIELIAMAHLLLTELGLAEIKLHINTLGDVESRAAYREALVAYFSDHREKLSDDSRSRLEKNPLRILDSKDPGDRKLITDAPMIDGYLTEDAKAIFSTVCAGLQALGIDYVREPRLVRGLDYYSHTAFEFITDQLGAQGTVLAGGRYDGLIEQIGGPATPGVGWAAGVDRLAELISLSQTDDKRVAVIPLDSQADGQAMAVAQHLRKNQVPVEMALRGNAKKRFKKADQAGCQLAVLVNVGEAGAAHFALKDLATGAQSDLGADLGPDLGDDNAVDRVLEAVLARYG
ncbi:MAG: histidine--tRNA ligase [Pseudomonadota bacterium]